jgi:hypothetical protein
VSQARTARSARGQHGGPAGPGPPLSAAGSWRWRCGGGWRRMGGPGIPAEAEGAVDQDLVAADRDVRADLEVGPAQVVLDLLVALLDPVADRVDPGDLSQAGRRVRAARLAGAAGAGRLVTRYQVALSGSVPGSAVATTRRRTPSGPHPPSSASAARQVSACPSRNVRLTSVQPPGSSGPPQASAVSVLFLSRGASSPARYSRNPTGSASSPASAPDPSAQPWPRRGPGWPARTAFPGWPARTTFPAARCRSPRT